MGLTVDSRRTSQRANAYSLALLLEVGSPMRAGGSVNHLQHRQELLRHAIDEEVIVGPNFRLCMAGSIRVSSL